MSVDLKVDCAKRYHGKFEYSIAKQQLSVVAITNFIFSPCGDNEIQQ